MFKYANATQNTRVFDKFEYYLEDMDCSMCHYWRGKKKGCSRAVCCCEDERAVAVSKGRIKRRKGWNRGWDKE
jgi:hypothetical protein